jgi:glycosyltransferase involved in cell wall biosynthesis
MANRSFRVTYVARSFLDYRVPVLAELMRLTGGQFTYVTSDKWTPKRALEKARNVLGQHLVVLAGERSLGTDVPIEANKSVCLPYQPGLVSAIRETEPDVIVGDGFFQWTAATLWLRARYGIPHVICYERTSHTERNAPWYRRMYRKRVMRWIDAICCSGSLCGDYTASLGFPKERMTFGHMVADTQALSKEAARIVPTETAAVRERFGLRGTVFLYVGQLISRKGINELLIGWSAFRKVHRDLASLLLIGDGPSRTECEQYCSENSLDDVHFAGAIDYDLLARYYRSADAFIIPTLEDNWSLVVPEAMACGLPILCSKYNGCWPELVQEGSNGWVFDPLDIESTGRALSTCVLHSARLGSMGMESRRIVATHNAGTAAQGILAACRIAATRKH